VADYPDFHSSPISAREDAKTVGAKLKSLGFTVAEAIDVKRSELDERLGEVAASLGSQDVVLFYFSGEGVQIGGTNYLLLSDLSTSALTDADQLARQGFPLDTVIEKLSGRKGGLTIMIIDAARDNPFKAKSSR
jgi:uncharacterized caspase-like protein